MRFFLISVIFLLLPNQVLGKPIDLSIDSNVNEKGQVALALTLKNNSSQPLFHIHPMFHFHHSRSMMTAIRELHPGQSITLENDEHPPVLRVGNYPITAMVNYKDQLAAVESKTVLHTDSFYFKEFLESQVVGSIDSSGGPVSSVLKIFLKNQSDSLKNIRMMLLLPPGMVAENFNGIMGLTLRGDEKKTFEVTVQRNSNFNEDRFSVRLMVEYGEMLKHYSREIKGVIQFSPSWYSVKYLPHFSVLLLMGLLILGLYFKFYNAPVKKKGNING
mgnify:CR=1 FL=1|tara:strand:- start:123 stop:944 length:822 start_codon:yes stop_codon:yes gene_type:complete